ncbi:MAG: hypothetical protein EP320_15345 [Rhodobacteraceae bacterium]|uniref:Porin n=1 Tax=Thioclava marina TaxID=1915077 RepID=A0ABX3MNQ2_9RHOB|nr:MULTISPECIES: hypothetical protein [Thioclava]TNE93041.1 MAG: hypothetical protein EP337_04485 [Paracoccaceae bacterium]MBD3804091.1 hypothetical protein [Thioclava sp.]OOY13168.1 hypothetical protein BMG00_05050 [Thioclava marina]OOY28880.1 hypothetical protein BMI90_00950 [Thioclava sp. L04-15]TNF11241.1 MAG: hypothetical protein EP320_15345 [Paracoccaceae bacterium]
MRKLILVAAIVCAAGAATAQDVTVKSKTDTKGFVGLNWTFGPHASGLEGVVGAMNYRIDPDGDVKGAKLSLHLGFGPGPVQGKIKLTGVAGQDDGMAELGLGYGSHGFFGTGGLLGDHWNVGGDLYFQNGWEGYAGLHSLTFDKPKAPAMVITPEQ